MARERRSGCALSGLLIGRPSPRQQRCEVGDLVIVDARQHVGEPGLWIDAVELGGLCRPPNYAERVGFSPDFSLTGV